METFDTYRNNQKINVNLVIEQSMAKEYGDIIFSLKKEDDLNKFIPLENNDNSTKIDKVDVETHCIYESVTHFILDSNQIPNKEKIIKDTRVKYTFFDQNQRSTFYSTYLDFPDEFIDGGSNVFRVIKRIKIVLNPDPRINHTSFLKTLNQ